MKERSGEDVPIRNFSPDDVALPRFAIPSMQQSRFKKAHTHQEIDPSQLIKPKVFQSEPPPCTLDGFRLLDICGVEFPDQAHVCDASGQGVVGVAADDLPFFARLRSLDVGRNACGGLEVFAALPSLRELKIPCNGLRAEACFGAPHFGGCFELLTLLDLSFNLVDDPSAVANLAVGCPSLRELDLTCNGLRELPPPSVMAAFKRLTKLVLERNGLEDFNPDPNFDAGLEAFGAESETLVGGEGNWNGGDDEQRRGQDGGDSQVHQTGHQGRHGHEGHGGGGGAVQGVRWSVLACCAACPVLEELQLGFNYLSGVPPEACGGVQALGLGPSSDEQPRAQLAQSTAAFTARGDNYGGDGGHGEEEEEEYGNDPRPDDVSYHRGGDGDDDDNDDDNGDNEIEPLHSDSGGGGARAASSSSFSSSSLRAFGCLQTLGLSFNYVRSELSLAPTAHLCKLRTLALYGNPLLGTTLEDPSGDSVGDLAAAFFHARNGVSTLPLDLLTEIPRPRRRKGSGGAAAAAPGGNPSGKLAAASARRSQYRNVRLARADEEEPLPSASQFKEAGRLMRYQQQQQQQQGGRGGGGGGGGVPRRRDAAQAKTKSARSSSDGGREGGEEAEDGGNLTGTFLTGFDPTSSATTAMTATGGNNKVAAGAAATIAELEAALFAGYKVGGGGGGGQEGNHSKESAAAAGEPPDELLEEALARQVPSDPSKLRGALAALRTSLRQPLAEHADSFLQQPHSLPGHHHRRHHHHHQEGQGKQQQQQQHDGGGESRRQQPRRFVNRPTAAAKARQQPTRTYEAPPLPPEMGQGAWGAGRGVQGGQGLGASLGRKHEAAAMMASIEADLDAMMAQRAEEQEAGLEVFGEGGQGEEEGR